MIEKTNDPARVHNAASRLLVLLCLLVIGLGTVGAFRPTPGTWLGVVIGAPVMAVMIAYMIHVWLLASRLGGRLTAVLMVFVQFLPILGVPLAISMALKGLCVPQGRRTT